MSDAATHLYNTVDLCVTRGSYDTIVNTELMRENVMCVCGVLYDKCVRGVWYEGEMCDICVYVWVYGIYVLYDMCVICVWYVWERCVIWAFMYV